MSDEINPVSRTGNISKFPDKSLEKQDKKKKKKESPESFKDYLDREQNKIDIKA